MAQPGSWVSGGAGLGVSRAGHVLMEKNGLPVGPLCKEFESAVESGDKPRVWTRGRNFERVQDIGPVEAWCLLLC